MPYNFINVTVFDISCFVVIVCEESLKSFHNHGSLLGGSWLDVDAIGD